MGFFSSNAATLNGATFAAPGAIGAGTPGTGAFTTITGQSTGTFGTNAISGSTFANGPNSGAGAGSSFVALLNGASNIGMGNYSKIISGGAFDATPVIYFGANAMIYNGGDNAMNFNAVNTPSTSKTTGTLVVSGGAGIGGSIYGGADLGFHPAASVVPVNNGDLVFQATSNTSFTIKYKGSDGTIRSGSITLA